MASRRQRSTRAAAVVLILISSIVMLMLTSLILLRIGQPERAWLILESRRVPVARDAATLSLLDVAVQRRDLLLLEVLESEGRVFTVASHRSVAILARPPADSRSVGIEIREGMQRGRTGWVRSEWLSFEPPEPSQN